MKRYRRALHLIDVRGKYEEGLKILDDLAGQDDVLAVPGQSAWMLAHAYRAALLTGNDFDEAQIVQAIRTQSVGTAFEPHVLQVLSAVAGQGSGLDAEFLEHLVAELRAGTSVYNLGQTYGRQILPYAKSIVDDPLDTYSFQTRTLAFHLAFSALDASSSRWAMDVLREDSPWATEAFKSPLGWGTDHVTYFLDTEAKDAGLMALQGLNDSLTADRAMEYGLSLVRCLGQHRSGPLSVTPTHAEQATMEILYSLIQEAAIKEPVGLLANLNLGNPAVSDWLVHQLSEWETWPHQQEFRDFVARSEYGNRFLEAWAREGNHADTIRLLLTYVDHGWKFTNMASEETIEWTQSVIDSTGYAIRLGASRPTQDWESMPEWAAEIFSGSESPVVRLLYGCGLMRNEEFEKVGLLLSDLGQDPDWAGFLLRIWHQKWGGTRLDQRTLEVLVGLTKIDSLREFVGPIMTSGNGLSLPYATIMECDLDLKPGHLELLLIYARDRGDVDSIQQLLRDHFGTPGPSEKATHYLSELAPETLLAMQDEIHASGHFALHAHSIVSAWKTIWERGGREQLLNRIPEIMSTARAMPPESSARYLYSFLGSVDQDLSIQVALEGFAPRVFAEVFSQGNSRNTYMSQGDPELTSRLVLACAEASISSPFVDKQGFIRSNLSANSTSARAALASLLDQPKLSRFEIETVIDLAIQNAEVREAMRERIESRLAQGKVLNIATSLQRWGAVEDFQGALLTALEGGLPEKSQAILLTTLSSLDDPQVIEALMDALNDPRPRVSSAASAGLDRIQRLRQQRAEWQAWSDGVQMVSPVVALMEDLKDPSMDIRIAAIQSLGTLCDKAALPVLVDLLREEDPAIKEAAKAALARINAAPQATEPKKD